MQFLQLKSLRKSDQDFIEWLLNLSSFCAAVCGLIEVFNLETIKAIIPKGMIAFTRTRRHVKGIESQSTFITAGITTKNFIGQQSKLSVQIF